MSIPALQGCVSFGETIDEAISNSNEAIEIYIETLRQYNEEIPNEEGVLEYNLIIYSNT